MSVRLSIRVRARMRTNRFFSATGALSTVPRAITAAKSPPLSWLNCTIHNGVLRFSRGITIGRQVVRIRSGRGSNDWLDDSGEVPVIKEFKAARFVRRPPEETAGTQRGSVAVTTFDTAAAWQRTKPFSIRIDLGLDGPRIGRMRNCQLAYIFALQFEQRRADGIRRTAAARDLEGRTIRHRSGHRSARERLG